MQELKINQNNGVLIAPPLPTDHIAGQADEIEEINPSADNRPYKPAEEDQSGRGGDKMTCVTVSGGGCIETCLNLLKAINRLPDSHLAWLNKWRFIGPDGIIRISSRWAAIQNGTTEDGAYLNAVAQWWRKNGFIPEWMLPNNQELTRAQYFNTTCLTDEMRQCAKESLEMFEIAYQWVFGGDEASIHVLKQGALQICTAVCPGWNNQSPVPACQQQVQHATEKLFIEPDGIKDIFDSYDPHNKKLSADYPIPYKMLYMVKPLKQDNMITIKQEGEPAIYAQSGNTLIPIGDWDTFLLGFDKDKIVEISAEEFAKFNVAKKLIIKTA
ncbi:MAG: hypothetical protein WC737_05770 [Parcubacteria group bacterium]|jgi:hypothetical protein